MKQNSVTKELPLLHLPTDTLLKEERSTKIGSEGEASKKKSTLSPISRWIQRSRQFARLKLRRHGHFRDSKSKGVENWIRRHCLNAFPRSGPSESTQFLSMSVHSAAWSGTAPGIWAPLQELEDATGRDESRAQSSKKSPSEPASKDVMVRAEIVGDGRQFCSWLTHLLLPSASRVT
jgi:hypothetical protein